MQNSLYAYFGLVDLHTVDMPGHSLYQLGLIDSISETFGDEKFDFFSYLPDDIIDENTNTSTSFPSNGLGTIFNKYYNQLIADNYCVDLAHVLNTIAKKEYRKLYLKARFRNLSTLAKKWKDTLAFEKIIDAALAAGYTKNEIVILDTDLSLPGTFVQKYQGKLSFLIPSISFPGISNRFLDECIEYHSENYSKDGSTVFYGNIDTSNYKAGNHKSDILHECISELQNEYENNPSQDDMLFLIHKTTSTIVDHNPVTVHVGRHSRREIWDTLIPSSIMLNVTKDKYNIEQFIPARVYEALIFGMIPVSYTFEWLSKTFSFNNIEDFLEIVKYIRGLDNSEDIHTAYLQFVKDYKIHVSGAPTAKLEEAEEFINIDVVEDLKKAVIITEEDIYERNR